MQRPFSHIAFPYCTKISSLFRPISQISKLMRISSSKLRFKDIARISRSKSQPFEMRYEIDGLLRKKRFFHRVLSGRGALLQVWK